MSVRTSSAEADTAPPSRRLTLLTDFMIASAAAAWSKPAASRYVPVERHRPAPRTGPEVARFFDGLDLVDPGLVTAPRWNPGAAVPESRDATDSFHAGGALVRR